MYRFQLFLIYTSCSLPFFGYFVSVCVFFFYIFLGAHVRTGLQAVTL